MEACDIRCQRERCKGNIRKLQLRISIALVQSDKELQKSEIIWFMELSHRQYLFTYDIMPLSCELVSFSRLDNHQFGQSRERFCSVLVFDHSSSIIWTLDFGQLRRISTLNFKNFTRNVNSKFFYGCIACETMRNIYSNVSPALKFQDPK